MPTELEEGSAGQEQGPGHVLLRPATRSSCARINSPFALFPVALPHLKPPRLASPPVPSSGPASDMASLETR